MGDVSHFDINAQNVEKVLKHRHEEAQAGTIDGIIIISIRPDCSVVADVEGGFSSDPEDLAKVLGNLDMASKYVYKLATEGEE